MTTDERIRDTREPADPGVARAAAILRAVRPPEPSAESMRRVWRTVSEMRPVTEQRRDRRPRPRRALPIWAAVGIAILVGAATAAAASLVVREIRRHSPGGSVQATPAHVGGSVGRHVARSEEAKSAPEPVSFKLDQAIIIAAPARSADEASQAALLVQALQALRDRNQPAHAAQLLDGYLAQYPNGSLIEEALALDIEAEHALGSARVGELAEEYLRRFPEGRFVQAAEAAKQEQGR